MSDTDKSVDRYRLRDNRTADDLLNIKDIVKLILKRIFNNEIIKIPSADSIILTTLRSVCKSNKV